MKMKSDMLMLSIRGTARLESPKRPLEGYLMQYARNRHTLIL